jgi:iron-sulfur cluster assembly protein
MSTTNENRPAPPAAFRITEKAATRIRTLTGEHGGPDKVLLVGVKTKGCSGLSYDMSFVEHGDVPALSETVKEHGVTVAVDPKASMFLFGTTMDFVESPLKSGFEFINPNETGRCGCGESFSVEKE